MCGIILYEKLLERRRNIYDAFIGLLFFMDECKNVIFFLFFLHHFLLSCKEGLELQNFPNVILILNIGRTEADRARLKFHTFDDLISLFVRRKKPKK